jgi:divalent metal cation (Fe/Co/Zn/Cd) transporter
VVLRNAIREIYARLMDAVDPALVTHMEEIAGSTAGVHTVDSVRVRWIGHSLRADVAISVDDNLTVVAAHHIAVDTEHRLIHQIPRLTTAMVHADPVAAAGDHHAELDHHDR